jgi:rSAM/selenodomain-associated transferase 1
LRVLVFAKAPEPGRVKTRLAAAIGEAAAVRLHARLVVRTLATAVAARAGEVVLCCAPDTSHPLFIAMTEAFGVALAPQGEGDVGERMARSLERFHPAILVGCDCPAFTPEHLHRAANALANGADVVLTPAEDGGYVLVGVRVAQPGLFAGMTWSHPGVLEETRLRAAALGLSLVEMETLWDVDRPADLDRLRALMPSLEERDGT